MNIIPARWLTLLELQKTTLVLKSHNKGFTLIEILITLSIIAIISVVGFINIRSLRQNQDLDKNVGDIKSYLNTVYTNAVTNVTCNDGPGGQKSKWVFEYNIENKRVRSYCGYLNTVDGVEVVVPNVPNGEIRAYGVSQEIRLKGIILGTSQQCVLSDDNVTVAYVFFEKLTGNMTYKIKEVGVCSVGLKRFVVELAKGTTTRSFVINQSGSISDYAP